MFSANSGGHRPPLADPQQLDRRRTVAARWSKATCPVWPPLWCFPCAQVKTPRLTGLPFWPVFPGPPSLPGGPGGPWGRKAECGARRNPVAEKDSWVRGRLSGRGLSPESRPRTLPRRARNPARGSQAAHSGHSFYISSLSSAFVGVARIRGREGVVTARGGVPGSGAAEQMPQDAHLVPGAQPTTGVPRVASLAA